MPTVTLNIDVKVEEQLTQLSADAGLPASEYAARLLRRALRAQRPRPVVDWEAVRRDAEEFADEDLALAESDMQHRAELLHHEDTAE